MKTLRSFAATLLALMILGSQAWSQNEAKEEAMDLFKEAVKLLEKAELSDELENRRLLQDLDLEDLPDADKAIEDAKARVQELLKEKGVFSKDLLEKARAAVDTATAADLEEANASSTDVLGPAPKKAPKKRAPELGTNSITIENSGRFAGALDDGVLVFQDDVFVTTDQFTLRCDKLEVFLEESNIATGMQRRVKMVIATGKMVVINGVNEEQDPVEARCQTAIYKDDTMYLRDWPEVKMGEQLLQAKDKKAYIKLESVMVDGERKINPTTVGAVAIKIPKTDPTKDKAP